MPSSKTVSTCAPQTELGTHLFHILGYSQHRAAEAFIWSDKFTVLGHDWRLSFGPLGTAGDIVVAGLHLMGINMKAVADARWEIRGG